MLSRAGLTASTENSMSVVPRPTIVKLIVIDTFSDGDTSVLSLYD